MNTWNVTFIRYIIICFQREWWIEWVQELIFFRENEIVCIANAALTCYYCTCTVSFLRQYTCRLLEERVEKKTAVERQVTPKNTNVQLVRYERRRGLPHYDSVNWSPNHSPLCFQVLLRIAILHGILASSKQQLLSFELNSHLASCFDLKSEGLGTCIHCWIFLWCTFFCSVDCPL